MLAFTQADVSGFLEFFTRKGAHLFIFFILGLLTRGVWNTFIKNKFLIFLGSLLFVIVYASFDEVHQYYTGGRTPLVQDVFIDTIGGTLGILTFLFIIKIRTKNSH
ncbi:VanZ family protein [Bacillus massiliglaciei]|uniref:VanZ family protein n=1 Tax=Bacillus massiliglaciei TaxID=1816693 RepID=UPI000DA60158